MQRFSRQREVFPYELMISGGQALVNGRGTPAQSRAVGFFLVDFQDFTTCCVGRDLDPVRDPVVNEHEDSSCSPSVRLVAIYRWVPDLVQAPLGPARNPLSDSRTREPVPGFSIEVTRISLIAKISTGEAGPAVVMVRDRETAPVGTLTLSSLRYDR